MSSVLKTLSLSLLALPLIACGGGKKNDPMLIDAPGGGSADAPAAACLLPSSFGTVTPSMQETHSAKGMGSTTPDLYYSFASLNDDASPDVLLIELYKGFTVFDPNYPAGALTVQLTGEELDYATCGACIQAQTDYTMSGPTGDPYFATGGTLNLTSVSDTSVAGTITNLQLAHATIDGQTGTTTLLNDGCTSTVASISFSGTPVADPAVAGKVRLSVKVPNFARQ